MNCLGVYLPRGCTCLGVGVPAQGSVPAKGGNCQGRVGVPTQRAVVPAGGVPAWGVGVPAWGRGVSQHAMGQTPM